MNGGHLGSNLGAVELTLALHRVFDSPRDAIVWDTGHQSYVHKLVTGRLDGFSRLRQGGGMSGYPSRAESEHDLVENSHASTAVSYAYGLAVARDAALARRRRHRGRRGDRRRRAHRRPRLRGARTTSAPPGRRAVIVLNDNGRCYAPTVSRLTIAGAHRVARPVTPRRSSPRSASTTSVRSTVTTSPRSSRCCATPRHATGPSSCTCSRTRARATSRRRPTTRSASTTSARSTPRPACRSARTDRRTPPRSATRSSRSAEERPEIVAITAGMPGSTGLLPFAERFPDRCFDVGIAEQHAVTAAAGMAMRGPASGGRRSTPRSSAGRGTRWSTTSASTACPSCSASTAPASPATTARATTVSTTSRCSPRCPASRCSRRRRTRRCR